MRRAGIPGFAPSFGTTSRGARIARGAFTGERVYGRERRNRADTPARSARNTVCMRSPMAFGMEPRPRPVLIVDADIETPAAERQLLAESGFRVVEADNGNEALQAMQPDPPAVAALQLETP